MTLEVKQDQYTYTMNEDFEFVCDHNNAVIQKACCSTLDRGSSGHIECGCGGMDFAICYNPNCTGITEEDADRIFNYGGEQ